MRSVVPRDRGRPELRDDQADQTQPLEHMLDEKQRADLAPEPHARGIEPSKPAAS